MTRCAPAMKARLDGLVAEHSIWHSREKLGGYVPNDEERAARPAALHPLVRRHPGSGRMTLYLASHATHIVGMDVAAGKALLRRTDRVRDAGAVRLSPQMAGRAISSSGTTAAPCTARRRSPTRNTSATCAAPRCATRRRCRPKPAPPRGRWCGGRRGAACDRRTAWRGAWCSGCPRSPRRRGAICARRRIARCVANSVSSREQRAACVDPPCRECGRRARQDRASCARSPVHLDQAVRRRRARGQLLRRRLGPAAHDARMPVGMLGDQVLDPRLHRLRAARRRPRACRRTRCRGRRPAAGVRGESSEYVARTGWNDRSVCQSRLARLKRSWRSSSRKISPSASRLLWSMISG